MLCFLYLLYRTTGLREFSWAAGTLDELGTVSGHKDSLEFSII